MDIYMSEDSKTVFKSLETFLVFFSLLGDKGAMTSLPRREIHYEKTIKLSHFSEILTNVQ